MTLAQGEEHVWWSLCSADFLNKDTDTDFEIGSFISSFSLRILVLHFYTSFLSLAFFYLSSTIPYAFYKDPKHLW